jgi:hypothetical protein
MSTAEVVGAVRTAAVTPLGYLQRMEVRMGEPVYNQLQTDLNVQGFGTVCGLPVIVDNTLGEVVEIVGLMGEPPEEDESQ